MSTMTEAPPLAADSEIAPAADLPFRLTSDQFEQMVDRGLLPDDARVYLWDGMLYEKKAKTRPHAYVQSALTESITRRLPPQFGIGSENPVRLDPSHLPLPDLIVTRGRPIDFPDRYPDGRDVLLVVEVAVTSLGRDLGNRLARYGATLPLAAYIVADVAHRQIVVHADPRPGHAGMPAAYANLSTVKPGEQLRLHLDGVGLAPIPYEEVMR